MLLPLLQPVGKISHGLVLALVAIHVARFGHLRMNPIMELVNEESAKSVVI
jgi:hypothetical protein